MDGTGASGVASLSRPDGKERLEDCLTAADGTFAGFCEPVALGKYEAAGTAFGRGHFQMQSCGVEAEADMLQMAVDVLFRDVRLAGYLQGRQRLVEDEFADESAKRLPGRARNGRFAWKNTDN